MKGKIVAVVHRSTVNPKTGRASLYAAKQQNKAIEAVYHDGSVRVSSGDVWKIKPSSAYKGAEFVTVS